MDLYKAIRTLYDEKKRLDKLIESLEHMQTRGASPEARVVGRRGRRRMSPDERREVSERMRKYWATRRQHSEPMQRMPLEAPETADAALASTPTPVS